MHAILFGIKRAFRTSVEVLLRNVRDFELTPARYELLFIVHKHGLRWMSQVRRMLGVTAATVSRMVKSLVELGLVTIKRPACDRRQREITLTRNGEDSMRGALDTLRDSGAIDFYVESLFDHPCRDKQPMMIAFANRLQRMRLTCGDTSTDPDPWEPNDYDDESIAYEGLQELEDLEPEDLGPDAVIPASIAADVGTPLECE